MAKGRGLRTSKLEGTGVPTQRFAAATVHSQSAGEPKRGVAHAHAKHQHDYALREPAPLCLADRFHALPAELRAEIFSYLLVRPGKWKVTHDPSCHLYKHPDADLRSEAYHCARCAASYHPHPWRERTTTCGGWKGAWVNPRRSKYAPPVTNEFMCTDCWDEHFRCKVTGSQFPKLDKDMLCLCARRTDLDVLLVCRRWYTEASDVLWPRNTFAFESCETLTAFAADCPAPARERVKKISVLDFGRHHPSDLHGPHEWLDWDYHKKRKPAIAALRRFPALTHLELDSCFLRDAREVQALMRVGLRGLRSVRFVHHEVATPTWDTTNRPVTIIRPRDGMHSIFPLLRETFLLRGGLAEEVARAMKGQHRGWTKHRHTAEDKPSRSTKGRPKWQKTGVPLLKTAVQRHLAIEEALRDKKMPVPPHRIVNCDDERFWEQLWWKTDGRLHWSQSYLEMEPELYDPKHWSKGVRPVEDRPWWQVFPFAEWDLMDWTWEDEFPLARMKL